MCVCVAWVGVGSALTSLQLKRLHLDTELSENRDTDLSLCFLLLWAEEDTETDNALSRDTERIEEATESLNLQAAAKLMEDSSLLMGSRDISFSF